MSTDLESSVESLDHPVDNAPVRTLQHKGLTIEGYSRAAVQTYWRVPEMKLGFDLGAQPWSFMATPNWFVSHVHLDHVAALPVLVARRRMMKMEPPTIYLPAEAVEGVEMLLRAIQRLDRGRMPATLIGLKPGDEVELSRELVVKAFATKHTIPSLGYLVWERRKKLKPEYHDLAGDQIRDLRLSGVEVSAEIRLPKVAYLGDTAPAGARRVRRDLPGPDLDPRDDLRRTQRAPVAHPQVRPHPSRRPDRPGRPVRERGDHRLALQHPAAPRPDPADRREEPARLAAGRLKIWLCSRHSLPSARGSPAGVEIFGKPGLVCRVWLHQSDRDIAKQIAGR